ncbi:MAG: hypothetical protein H7067_00200 [Burkholderiales bacterium]|nr:hypothetical protein [Opitutaceae bacterium]
MNAQALVCISTLLAFAGTGALAQTASKRKSPTSKFYVAEVNGFAQVNTGEKIEDLTEKSVFDAEGTTIETKPESDNALVMSNGTGIYFAPDTKMAVKRFLQEPFSPNRTDLESEPSVSQTKTSLARGSVGLCTGKLVAGSSMTYDTPHGSINILSQSTQKLAIEITEDETVITLFEGAVTLRGDNMAGGESLQPGQQAVIKSRGVNQPPEIVINAIPTDQFERIGNMVNSACQARKKVYFDVADRELNVDGADSELIPFPLTPVDPTAVGPIVSPARARR